jgi:hypothetical protein
MTTTNDKGVDVCGTDPPRTNQNEHREFATDTFAGKALKAMRPRAGLCGCTLPKFADGAYLLGGRGEITAVPCLLPVCDLLRQIGGAR